MSWPPDPAAPARRTPPDEIRAAALNALIALEDPARDRSGEAARVLRNAFGGAPLRNARHTGFGTHRELTP